MKKTLIAFFVLGIALSAVAQTNSSSNAQTQKKSSKYVKTTSCSLKIGDKVYVDRANERYLTGERISKWVYDSIMTVQQIGTKKFPEGILLAPITSWVAGAAVGAEFYPIIPAQDPTQQQEPSPTQGEQPSQPQAQTPSQPSDQPQPQAPAEQPVPSSTPAQGQSQQQVQGPVAVAEAAGTSGAVSQSPIQSQPAQPSAQPIGSKDNIAQQPAQQQPAEIAGQTQPQAQVQQPSVQSGQVQAQVPGTVVADAAIVEEAEMEIEPDSVMLSDVEPDPELEADVEQVKRVGFHRFGVGIKGGVADLFQTVGSSVLIDKRKLGLGAGLDIEYTYLSGALSPNLFQMGVKTGVSVAYAGNSIVADAVTNSYSRKDNDGRALVYTVDAKNVCEKDNQLMVQIPLMFALRSSQGLYFAIGPKFSLPFNAWYSISYSNPNIDCYFVDYDVHEKNQVVTGKLTGVAPLADNKLRTTKFNVLVGGEIGYEFDFQGGSHLGILGYCDYNLYSPYPHEQVPTTGFIQVDGPKAGGANINSVSLMNVVGNGMSYLNAGIKVVYSFNLNNPQEEVAVEEEVAE